MGKKYEVRTDKKTGLTAFVASAVPGLTRASADRLVKAGEVRVNGARVKQNIELDAGDVIHVFVPDGFCSDIDIPVVYEDDNIVIFNKPKRISYDKIPHLAGLKLFAVHRLDTNTSGLIMFAKTQTAKLELEKAFAERKVKKTYEAVVSPPPEKDRDRLTAYIAMSRDSNTASVSAHPRSGYKTMVTEYEVVKRAAGKALLRVYPHTGRTHQIRAHMRFIGCPIVGDPKYGKPGEKGSAQMLCAVELAFCGLTGELGYLDGKVFCIPGVGTEISDN